MKYLLCMCVIFFSCNLANKIKKQNANFQTILYNEGPWNSNFKNLVFTEILSKMYGKEFIDCCLKKDASNSANFDWLNYDTSMAIRISFVSNEFMKRKHLKGTIESKKIMMNYALQYRNSHELDSITGEYYLQYRKDSISNSK